MDWNTIARSEHLVHFYEHDGPLIELVTDFIEPGLMSGAVCIVVATPEHRALFVQSLEARGVLVAEALRDEQLVMHDAAELLSLFIRDGVPESRIFAQVIAEVVEGAVTRSATHPVRVFGEMVDVLLGDGALGAALLLEQLWSDLARVHPFALLCAYAARRFDTEDEETPFLHICDAHSRVLPGEEHRAMTGLDEHMRALARMEQRVRALGSEVSKQRIVEKEIRERLRELAETNRRKDDFLAMLGHELRNPLSAVTSAVLAAQRNDDGRDRALAIAQRQTQQLARLVDDLLDVARIAHGRIRVDLRPLDLAKVLEQAIESTRSLTEARGHELALSAPTQSVYVDADRVRLEQVVGNLLTNAAKYTPQGGRIEVGIEQQAAEVILRVKDSGIGIAPDKIAAIFEPFTQLEPAPDGEIDGLGIGLSLTREIVALHGGHVEVESLGPGMGSEFVVRLPAIAAPPTNDETTPTDEGIPRPVHILVVEDNRDAAEALALLLEGLGHRVVVAHQGDAALQAAGAAAPDVMLIDIGLPGFDGYELATRLRADPALQSVVLVALSGYGQRADRERARVAGFDHHLLKPVDLARLRRVLDRAPRIGRLPA